jgi:hypothetical protein
MLLLARDQNRLYRETQPRHPAAQVTLLEVSFVFLPCRRQVPLVWGENSSSEQHSFGKLPILLPLGARKESSSEHSIASSSEHSRSSSSGGACSSSGMQQHVWMFAAGRMVLRFFLGSHGTLVAVSAPFMMPLRDSDIPMNVPFTFSSKQPLTPTVR